MQVSIGSPKAASKAKAKKPKDRQPVAQYAIGEINAYIAIRDELLAEAEELRTRSKLDSLILANDFVETCLTPSRPPYQDQFLPEADASRERQRCRDIKLRAADLRQHVETRSDRGREHEPQE